MIRTIVIVLSSLIVAAAASTADTEKRGEIQSPGNDDDLIRFAIIADLTGGERPGVFSVGAEGIRALRPDFIMSVGDLIEGGTEDADQADREWHAFQKNLASGEIAFYPVVGNHDISNSVMRRWYERTVAPRYYHFIHKNALFMVLDTEDFSDEFFSEFRVKRDEAIEVYRQDPTAFDQTEYANMPERTFGRIGDAQTADALTTINENRNVRWTFIFMHKPVWKDESEANFKKIEKALGGQRYTVFTGHVHGYEHNSRLGQDYIQLATTGGERIRSSAKNMDHIMWVSLGERPSYLNIKLQGMLDKTGEVPAGGEGLCLEDDGCR